MLRCDDPTLTPSSAALAGAMAFSGARVGFYGSWVTSRVSGPFKGAPGTEWW